MRDFRNKRGTGDLGAKQLFLLLAVFSFALLIAGCAGLVAGNTTKPGNTGGDTSPVVSISAPTTGATLSGNVTVAATANDKLSIVSVQFELDGANAGTPVTAAPYTYVWDTAKSSNGSHSLKATATDSSGNVGTSSAVTVTVKNSTDTTPPTVSITSPASGATESGTITISATASDNVGVASVQFRVDGTNVGAADTTAPYTYSLNTATLTNGSHSLTAVAKDAAGNSATSAAVTITVNNAPDTIPPTVSITSPANAATESGTITISATASDNVGVASVQFRVDGTNVGAADTTTPYTYSLNTATLTNGSHSLTAVAKDAAGNSATSAAVTITVNNAAGTTPPTVSITSPTNGATVSGAIAVNATASDNVGVASVQFLLDGAALGSKVTTSPYSVLWNTNLVGNGSHTLAAKATDTAGNTATSSNVTVTVSQNTTQPPPPAGDQITITDASGSGQTNRPVSVARTFVQGEIANFAQASISGTALLTQCDVKNRWSDGSLKFAIVSFVVPSIPANGSVVVSFANQTSGNNTGYLAPSDMLGAAYNFDSQIKLSGTASHNISALAILNAANAGNGCGFLANGDIDGYLGTAGNYCAYWDAGPVRTCVILEDRIGRSFDVNTDGAAGSPLHPRFEVCFYPQSGQVEVGYTLEDMWASSTAANSARSQTYSYVLTYGNTSPATLRTQATETVINRTFWHHMYCAYGANAGAQNGCNVGVVNINNGWAYLAGTKVFPHWNPSYQFPTSGTGTPTPANFLAAWNSSTTNKTDSACASGSTNSNCITPYSQGNGSGGAGFFPAVDGACGGSNASTTGDGCSSGASNSGIGSGGAAYYHGPLTTWDITTLMSQDPNMLNVVTPGSADAGGDVPYWFREADTQSQLVASCTSSGNCSTTGGSRYYDSPSGSHSPQGRAVSINARTEADLAENSPSCTTSFPSEAINYGGGGMILGPFGDQVDTSHWPEVGFTAYITTGQYAYYEEMILQGHNAIGNSLGNGSCYSPSGHASWRQGAIGLAIYNNDQDREVMWALREMALCGTIALDGSPEQLYCRDKLYTNLASIEGTNQTSSSQCDLPSTGYNQEPYCGASGSAWSYGNTVRNSYPYIGTPYGMIFTGSTAYAANNLCQASSNCSPAYSGNATFMNAYSVFTLGWIDQLGFCPHTNGTCYNLQWGENYYINTVMDPNGPGLYKFGDYANPTIGCSVVSAPGTCTGNLQAITNLAGTGDTACSGWAPSNSCNVASGSLYAYYGTDVSFYNPSGSGTVWPRPAQMFNGNGNDPYTCADETYPGEVSAGLSFATGFTSTANANQSGTYSGAVGFSGATAYNTLRPLIYNSTNCFTASYSPKWDITPLTTSGTGTGPSSTPPTVSVTAPTSGATVSGTTMMTASASASTGNTIVGVQFQVDGSNLGSVITASPYSQSLNTITLTSGQHSLTAVATDSSDHQTTSAAVVVTVSNTVDTTPPTVPTGLTATPVTSAIVNLSWNPSTDNVGVTGYNVFRNGSQIGTSAGTTYQDTGLTASTSYSYTVSAFDAAGNVSAQSAPANATTPASSGNNPLATAPGWYQISFSELQGSENTSPCPPDNYGGYGIDFSTTCQNVYNAWSGAAADTARHRLIIWGGGHVDYYGNEVYALDLTQVGTCTSTSPCLYRLDNPSNPTACIGSNSCDANPDGTPIARHTYQGLGYIPTTDQFLSAGGGYYGGNGNQNVWTLNLSGVTSACAPNCTPTWTHLGSVTSNSGPGEDYTMAWDSHNQVMQMMDAQYNLEKFTPSTNTWTNETSSLLISGYNGTMIYDDADQLVFHMGCYTNCDAFWVSTASGSTYAQNNITLGSSCGSIQVGYPVMAWDPVAKVIRVLPNGSNVQYLLKPSTTSTTWNCTTETYGSTQGVDYPPAMNTAMRGVHGRFNYFADWDVYVFCEDATLDCWYFRPNR